MKKWGTILRGKRTTTIFLGSKFDSEKKVRNEIEVILLDLQKKKIFFSVQYQTVLLLFLPFLYRKTNQKK